MAETNAHEVCVTRIPRRGPSKGFWAGMFAVFLFAVILASVATAAARDQAQTAPAASATPVPTVAVSHAPRMTTPPDGIAMAR